VADSPKQLVEGWCALARSNVLLDYIEFAVSENICSQKLPLEIPAVGIFKEGFFKGTAQLLKLCLGFKQVGNYLRQQ